MRRLWSAPRLAVFFIGYQVLSCDIAFALGPSSQAPVVPFSNSVSNPATRPKAETQPPKSVVITRVTVAELQQSLIASRGASDSKLAQQLSSLDLTERLSSQKVAMLASELRGKKARHALMAIADLSEFLDLPEAEIPANAPPDSTTQARMISLTGDYLRRTILKLPDFTATRTVVSYEETPQSDEGDMRVVRQPLYLSDRYKEKVLYRDGHEVTTAESQKSKKPGPEDRYLITRGTFGPFLGWVSDAIAVPDALTWSRWENSGNQLLAVFRYLSRSKSPDFK